MQGLSFTLVSLLPPPTSELLQPIYMVHLTWIRIIFYSLSVTAANVIGSGPTVSLEVTTPPGTFRLSCFCALRVTLTYAMMFVKGVVLQSTGVHK